MSEEPLASRYQRLSEQFARKYNEEIERLTERIKGQLNKAIEKELDAMEKALSSGDIANAYYHKVKAEILLSSVLP